MRGITLRLAAESDRAFLLALFAADRAASLQPLGLSSLHRNALLEAQLRDRNATYARRFPGAAQWIVDADVHLVGHILLHETADSVRVLEFAIAPQHRAQGYGFAALALVLQRAAAQGRDVTLRVRVGSAALRLYQRLGFAPAEHQDGHLHMRWHARQNEL